MPGAQDNNYFDACENAPASVRCQPGQFISSGSFKYGRWDNSICPGPGVNSSTPSRLQIYNLPPRCLQGAYSCDLGNSSFRAVIFGDPYPGVFKHVRFKIKSVFPNY